MAPATAAGTVHAMSASELPQSSLTEQLVAWRAGNEGAFAEVVEETYADLKRIAARRIAQGGGTATLSPTELLHEVLMRAMEGAGEFKNRVHFFATMSLAIRSILVDHARARVAQKRGGHQLLVTLNDNDLGEDSMVGDLLAIEQALTQLEQLDPRCGKVMHLTYFGGLNRAEISELLQISVPTIDRDLKFARAWLNRALHPLATP